MNTNWTQAELGKSVKATTLHRKPASEGVVSGRSVEQILDRALPGSRSLEIDAERYMWVRQREAAARCSEALGREEEIEEKLGGNASELSAAELHPWAWSGASSLWQSGHFREAVDGVIRKINAETQNKMGRRDVSEPDLFKSAFNLDALRPGRSRLRRMQPDGSKTYGSVQRGAMNFVEGIFAGIRNLLSHEADRELNEQEALEYLAALNVLALWVDAATVERAEGKL